MAVAAVIVLALHGSYRHKLSVGLGGSGRPLVAAIFGGMIALTGQSIVGSQPVEPLSAFLPMLAIAILVPVGHRWARGGIASRLRVDVPRRRTLVFGAGPIGRLVATRAQADPEAMFDVVAILDPRVPSAGRMGPGGADLLGPEWDFADALAEYDIEHVVVAFPDRPTADTLEIVGRCQASGMPVSNIPRFYERTPRRVTVEHLGGLPIMTTHASDPAGLAVRTKYAADRLVATLLLILAAPAMGITALAVAVKMGRPIFFRQERIGLRGEPFTLLKFRSMAGGGSSNESTDSTRVTPLGRLLRGTSLDELPQLFNVLRGDMSLVGPRPETRVLAEDFEQRIHRYGERHRVRPGITGWAQVHGIGRGGERFSEDALSRRAEWDNFYAENWSLWLDLKIAYMTFRAVLRFRQD